MGNNFCWALSQMRMGLRVARPCWEGRDRWMALMPADDASVMDHPYLYGALVDGTVVPWAPGNLDLLAEDWFVVSD